MEIIWKKIIEINIINAYVKLFFKIKNNIIFMNVKKQKK